MSAPALAVSPLHKAIGIALIVVGVLAIPVVGFMVLLVLLGILKECHFPFCSDGYLVQAVIMAIGIVATASLVFLLPGIYLISEKVRKTVFLLFNPYNKPR